MRQWVISLAFLLSMGCGPSADTVVVTSEPYLWKNVQMVGGGFVDGIVFHPTEPGVRYARTDMGGAYRWDPPTQRWQPILDWVSYEDTNLMGVESIALDPADPDRVFLACGTYTAIEAPNAVLRSSDRGRTWARTDVEFRMGGNEDGRGNGERMAVDPLDGRVLFMGTRHDGLWTSDDRGVTWRKVSGFPDITEILPPDAPTDWQGRPIRGSGIVVVIFHPDSGREAQRCSRIYVGVSLANRSNLFVSEDAGKTWQEVADHPRQYRPTHASLAGDGSLYVTYGSSPGPSRMRDGAVWKLDTRGGEWIDVTPDRPGGDREFGYAAVSVDPQQPRTLIVSTFGRPGGEEVFRSTDGGGSWKGVFASGGSFDYSKAPYVEVTGIHWLFDIEIDPADSDHAIFTCGYGGHETFNLTAVDRGQPTLWHCMATGIEETVALELLSPPSGAHLISAVGDYGGFVHWDLDRPDPIGNFTNPHFGNTDGVASAELRPEIVVRVGVGSHQVGGGNIGYSLDFGKTWQTAGQPAPDSAHGHIAVSSDGRSWVWTPQGQRPHVTHDRGATWTECQGLDADLRVIADRVNPGTFYSLDLFGGRLLTSTDRGLAFTARRLELSGGVPRPGRRGDPRGGQDRLYATPGTEGDLWLAAYDGLHHSRDGGHRFVRLPSVQQVHAFGFGKAAPAGAGPALFLVGVVEGIRGIFRSDDGGGSWARVNDDQHQWGLVLHVTGDPKQYGRAYVGTHGRGTLYGDPTVR